MTKNRANLLSAAIKLGQEKLAKLSAIQKRTLEKKWDIEHAYYSSALEGSKISHKEFEKLAEKVN